MVTQSWGSVKNLATDHDQAPITIRAFLEAAAGEVHKLPAPSIAIHTAERNNADKTQRLLVKTAVRAPQVGTRAMWTGHTGQHLDVDHTL